VSQTTSLLTSLPIAELFHSLQGEGVWTGTPMHFIRTAGCSVGEPQENLFPILKTGKPAWLCHTYDGRAFWCDTDFQHGERITFDTLFSTTWEKHICLTGGEPLLHKNIDEFVHEAARHHKRVHIETSGTIYREFDPSLHVWITVSPKQGCLDSMINQADEVKLLVDKGFDLNKVPPIVLHHPIVYIQPVNDELAVNKDNLQLCLDILHAMPAWRLSVQLHKVFNWR